MRNIRLPPQPLSALLTRVGQELERLRTDGRSLEDAIGQSILGEEPSTQDTLANLQGIDMIVQTLGELSDYVVAVSETLPSDPVVDVSSALSRIKLRDLARKLSGGHWQPVVNENGAISGEVDLF